MEMYGDDDDVLEMDTMYGSEVQRPSFKDAFMAKKNTFLAAGAAVLVLLVVVAIASVGVYMFVGGDDGSSGGGGGDGGGGDEGGDGMGPTPPSPTPNSNYLWSSLFLPTDVQPTSYEIQLVPNLKDYTFSGSANISMTLTKERDFLVLHQAALDIAKDFVLISSDGSEHFGDLSFNPEAEYVFFVLKKSVPKGDYELRVDFTGTLNDEMRGFYRSTYVVDGETKVLGTTQFESTDARRAFPCFDQPDFKAIFQISLVVPDDLTVLSNTAEEERTAQKHGQVLVRFERTPIMSTYLVAFVVGDLRYVESTMVAAKSGQRKPIRAYAVPGKEEQCEFAVQVAKDALEWYERYFDFEYPINKLDMIAIPDFSAGAMENWGLVTYRETALLLDEASDSAANRQRVATVVTHELAHQWTGNLVTMKWWGDLWLNEGFANFFETESADALFPSWRMRDQFIVDDQQRAMETDSLASSHPIHSDVKTADDISEIFDSITYSKGGSFVRMVQAYLGKETFMEGMRYHISQHAYGNAVAADLFASLSHAAGEDLEPLLHKWIFDAGFPLVSVSVAGSALKVKQDRFLLRNNDDEDTGSPWWLDLRVSWRNSDGPEVSFQQSLTDQSATLKLPSGVSTSAGGFFKLNQDQAGFYRVAYSDDLYNALSQALRHGEIERDTDRGGVLNDALVLARAGRLSTTRALELCKSLSSETSFVVWTSVLSELSRLSVILAGETCYGDFHEFMRDILDTVVDHVGWETREGEDHLLGQLRSSVLASAVAHHHHNSVVTAVDIFWEAVNSRKNVDGNIRSAVYRAAIENEGEAAFAALKAMYLASDNAADKKTMLYAFGHAQTLYLLRETLEMAMDPNVVRPQDRNTIIAGVAANPLGRDLAWNFLRENWDALNARGFGVSGTITITTRAFADALHRADVETFFAQNPPSGGERTVQLALESIDANMAWLARNRDEVCSWLERQ
eukprot:TRINITY_DN4312_c0_g1_i2.p1 TRINITY_DN4312_c0_g1~~TRINITY_DN4312_c0_g1_i2.p1  ORF type:complete len:965 (+),score=290.45 TRINITY_DN4312_c0_g1_i2:154-3048(+)